jgi:hypothetical protein
VGTKSTRSAGTQVTSRGITQGTTLVGPKSGLPIDEVVDVNGVRRLAVDGSFSANIDNVNVDLDPAEDGVYIANSISGNQLYIHPDGSIDANTNLTAASGDNVAISDGTNTLQINPDGSINVNINPSTTPSITNIAVPAANTEQSHTFPANTKKIKIRARGNSIIKYSFNSGQSGTNYITIFPGNTYEETDLKLTSVTVYFQLTKAGDIVEILSWI